jgi:hypothetical protein
LLLPSLVFILVAFVSARLAATDYADEAARFLGRLLAAAFFMLVGLRLGRHPDQARGVLWAVAAGAGVSGLLGLGEAVRWPPLVPVLELFKVAPTHVGGELRTSASFQYATLAAMYFEMVAPLAIVLAATARHRWAQVLGVGIAVVCTANVVLSLTRAGMLTLLAIYAALVAIACARAGLRRVLLPTLVSAAALVGGTIVLLVHDPVFDLRLQTESDADWYGAVYSAPMALNLQADQASTIELDVRNAGRITWTSSANHPFALGYRWLTEDGTGVLDVAPAEVPLTHDVAPGQTIHVQANLAVPDLPAGRYRLDWGMLQQDVLHFDERGWEDAETHVVIAREATGGGLPAVSPRDDGEAPWVVGRMELWGAAERLIAAHPVLGVGPDNFRHYYGAELGLEAWDERVTSNDVYLEVLTDLGVLGLAAFAWIVGGPLLAARRVALGEGPGRSDDAAAHDPASSGRSETVGACASWGQGSGEPESRDELLASQARCFKRIRTSVESVPGTGVSGAGGGRAGAQAVDAESVQLSAVRAVQAGDGEPGCHGTSDRDLESGPGGEARVGGSEPFKPAGTRPTTYAVAGASRAMSAGIVSRALVGEPRGVVAYLALGVGSSIVAFLVHGLLDSFLTFNPTLWLFWLLLGFASAWGGGVRRG